MSSTTADALSADRRMAPAVLTTLAFGLASVPTGFAIDHILIVPATVLFVGIAAALWARGFRSASTVKPSAAELVLAFADALILPCVLGATWIGAYWAIHGVTSLAGGPANAIALWVTTPLIAFLAWVFAELSAADAAKELYPDAVGAPSLFAPTIAAQGRRLYGYFLGAILGAVGLTLLSRHLTGGIHPVGLDLVLLGYGCLAGGLARPAEMDNKPEAAGEPIAEGLARAFAGVGYSIVRSPRTGEESADPFLLGVDLFVYRSGRAFVIEVKAPASSGDADWTLARSVVNAARALEGSDLPSGVSRVRPLLVLVDSQPDAHLKEMGEMDALVVLAIELAKPEFTVFGEAPGDDLSAVASRFLADSAAAAEPRSEPERIPETTAR
jgi:hypothetical protein